MAHSDRRNLMLQEFIPGGEDANWMFNGYFDQNSECLFGVTGRKLRQYRPYAGITSLGVCQPNPIVDQNTRRFMNTLGYRGILDIEYRYDARDGQYKVFDINPRIGCTFRLFVSDTGMDVARALYLNLTGQAIDAGCVLPGRKWMVEDMDLASAFRYWRDGKLTAGEWVRSFGGLQEFAFLALDDPLPVVCMCRNGVRELLRIRGTQSGTLSGTARLPSAEGEN
jgi:predicted ATP-grasp superfamily ATP-dependent carboligase